MDIPGAFETPYQLAPLDLGDDSFYRSRQADIEERLQRMTNTNAAIKMLREIDQVERDRGTLAIGVNWAYERQDLEEIITVSLFFACRLCGFLMTVNGSVWEANPCPSFAGCFAKNTAIAPAVCPT